MTKAQIFIYIGGGLTVLWLVFHLLLPRLFKWKELMEGWDQANRNLYQLLNICMIFFLGLMAYISFVYAPELLGTPLGNKLLGAMAVFWLMRFGLQGRFFRLMHPAALLINLACLATMVVYIYPLLHH